MIWISGDSMAEKIKPELLQFLQPGEVPLRILVVESLSYLPELRRMFPVAELSAVADEADRLESPLYEGLDVRFQCVDYRSEPLPYPAEYFDYIISDLTLEQAANPQDIAAGFSTFLKQTGAFLTSFRNIRHWSVLADLMDGHYYNVVSRLYAKTEFERLLYASFYKNVRVRPQRRPATDDIVERLEAAGFDNIHEDLETEFWLVRADRSMPELSLLKSMYTPGQRKELSLLLHRIEYGVDLPVQAQAFWRFYEEAGLFPDYTSAFIQSTVFHVERFYRQLMAVSGRQLDEIMALLQCGQAEALSEETAGRLQGLQHELEARLGKDGEDNA